LLSKDGEQCPSYGDARGQVTLLRGEGVTGRSGLEEEQSQEDKHLCPDTGMVCLRVDTECLKGGDDNEDGGPSVIQRKREVNENLICS